MEARHSDNTGETPNSGHINDLLSPFLDGELNADERRHVERHIAVCSQCAGQLAFLRAASRSLRIAPDAFPSPALFERIARATYQKPTFGQRVSAFLLPAPTRYAISGVIAAGLVAAVVVPRYALSPSANPQNPAGNLAALPAPSAITPSNSGQVPVSPVSPRPPKLAVPNAPAASAASLGRDAARGASVAQNVGGAGGAAGSPLPSAPKIAPATPKIAPIAPPANPATPRERFVASVNTSAAPPANRAVQKPIGQMGVAAVSPAAKRPTQAVRLLPVRKPVQMAMASIAPLGLRGGLTARGINSDLTRLSRPDNGGEVSFVTAAAPTPTRTEESRAAFAGTLPASGGAAREVIASSPAPAAPRISLRGSGTGQSNDDSVIMASRDKIAASFKKNPTVSIVDAPLK